MPTAPAPTWYVPQAARLPPPPYAYDNRLITAVAGVGDPGEAISTFAYDYRSRRYHRTTPTEETYHVFDGGLAVQEYTVPPASSGQPVVEFIRGEGMGGGVGGMVYSIRNGNIICSHANLRGDIIARSNFSGSLTSFALYEAYGTRPYEWGDDPDRQKANTKDEETDLDLLNEGMRYRDLATGTFMTRDPIGYADGPNVYCYVHCNPITQFDAFGLYTLFVQGAFNDYGERCNFTEDSKSMYMEAIGDTGGSEIVPWSGGNNAEARTAGAEALAAAVDNARQQHPDEPINVVGYSHGENVVIEASNLGAKFDNTVTVGTPVRADYQPKDSNNLGNWKNVYSTLDTVQVFGGSRKNNFGAGRTYDEKKNPNVENIKVPQNKADQLSASSSRVGFGVLEHLALQNDKGPKALKDHLQVPDEESLPAAEEPES